MHSLERFKKIISSSFWGHIHSNTFIPLTKRGKRAEFCEEIFKKMVAPDYRPTGPRGYVVSNKHNLVARIVPVFPLEDNCIYYYCVKSLENYLAVNKVDATFGGYRSGGAMRSKEEELFNDINAAPYSTSQFGYNKFGWVKEWGDFQKRAYQRYQENNLQYFIQLDIANFYDTINLGLLRIKIENELRSQNVAESHRDELALLFSFLEAWDKKFSQVFPLKIGLPQDEVGDSSRILANFFLQEYDKAIFEYCERFRAKYLRYADDQIILAPSREIAEDILFFASKELKKIGLNINAGKVRAFQTRGEYETFWAFGIFKLLEGKPSKGKIEKAIREYFTLDKQKFRAESVLRRILECDMSGIDISLKMRLLAELLDSNFLSTIDDRRMKIIYSIIDTESDRRRYLEKLELLCDKVLFNSFHYNLLRAKAGGLPINFEDKIIARINTLAF
jgi:hypothetical protein